MSFKSLFNRWIGVTNKPLSQSLFVGSHTYMDVKEVVTPSHMRPRIKVITLAVNNLQKSLVFYRDGMGLPTEGIIGDEYQDGAVVFFNMNDDLILALYPREALAKDARVAVTPPSPVEFSLGHIVRSKAEVDNLIDRAKQAGAVVTDPPHDRFWGGYSGYIQDLDGHLWEIAWNPQWEIKD